LTKEHVLYFKGNPLLIGKPVVCRIAHHSSGVNVKCMSFLVKAFSEVFLMKAFSVKQIYLI